MKKITTFLVMSIITILSYSQITIIPKPNSLELNDEYFKFNSQTVIYSNEKNKSNISYTKEYLNRGTNFKIETVKNRPINNYIILDISSSYDIPNEGYKLSINNKGVLIKASTEAGIFYGIQSLLQMLPATVYSGKIDNTELIVQGVNISDYPRFSYRGMMLDVSRTFFDAKTVKQYINWLSYHKINKFHWHLTDDNGWRIEIKKYPKLTQLGAWRGDNEVLSPSFGSGSARYGGYYTQEEIKDIVAYAAERHIEIIPEIDLPGHSRAVTASYPNVGCDGDDNSVSVQGESNNVWCVGKEDNFKMLENIIKEVASLFPSKYIHIGGDEVNYDAWDNCPHCQNLMKKREMKKHEELLNYFVKRMESILEKHGKYMAGWDEILDGGELKPNTRVYAWRSVAKGIESVTKGQSTIMMPGEYCYFDMKQSPVERGHNWAGIVTTEKSYSLDPIATAELNDKQANLIVGIQAALWTELLGYPNRFIEYQTFPRIAAIAEVGWTNPENKEWNNFNSRLKSAHYERMYQMGIAFRLEPPKADYVNGSIIVLSPEPWLVVRYTTDESEPNMYSPIYRGEIITDRAHKFRFATFYRDEIKSVSIKPENADYTYLKPVTRVETNMIENSKFPIKNVTDYNFNTYFRTTTKTKEGDYFTYIFEEPVKASRITIETGIPKITFYGVTDGYAEYSYDGKNFEDKSYFNKNIAILYPKKPILKVRITITKPNDGHILSLQDLKIEE